MFRWNFLCFSPPISKSRVDYGESTAGAIQSSRFQLQYSKTKLENKGFDQWLCWRQQNTTLLLAVSKCRDVLAKCFYIRDIFKPTAHIQIRKDNENLKHSCAALNIACLSYDACLPFHRDRSIPPSALSAFPYRAYTICTHSSILERHTRKNIIFLILAWKSWKNFA